MLMCHGSAGLPLMRTRTGSGLRQPGLMAFAREALTRTKGLTPLIFMTASSLKDITGNTTVSEPPSPFASWSQPPDRQYKNHATLEVEARPRTIEESHGKSQSGNSVRPTSRGSCTPRRQPPPILRWRNSGPRGQIAQNPNWDWQRRQVSNASVTASNSKPVVGA